MTGKDSLRIFLRTHLQSEFLSYYGVTDDEWIDFVTAAWLDDDTNSQWRYDDITNYIGGEVPEKVRILDMACGCGTFVNLGLLNGLSVWGIEPEDWKHTLNRMKVDVYEYPINWKDRYIKSVGEALPFSNNSFDYVSSYQTIEHVQDIQLCLEEMIRVLRPKGALFLYAPDYRGTYEGHYRLPWLPLFPRSLAQFYLKVLRRPKEGLEAINYVTSSSLKRMSSDYDIEIIEPDILRFQRIIQDHFPILGIIKGDLLLLIWQLYRYSLSLFRNELTINLIIVKGN